MQNNDETPQLPVPFTPPTSSYTQNISPYSNTDFNPYTSYEAPPFSQNVGGGYFSNNIAPYSQMPLNPTPQSNYAIPLQSYASVPLGSNSNAKRIGPRDFSTATYEAKQVQAVIVTIADHSSYDNLFHEIEQTAPNPEKEYVSVFSISSNSIESLLEYFRSNKELEDPVLKEMMKEITSIEGDCVVFNWECCGGCSSKAFPIAKKIIFQFVKELLDRKMLCMFSDFSLKALIAQWDSELLGPNPFIQVGEFSNSFNLAFVPQTLLDCPSAQLQKVGELCANGTATVGALGGTILYTVKPDYSNPSYELTILTVVTSHGGEGTVPRANDPNQPLCKIDALQGLAGHVTVSYPSGGIILTSCGHWIELVRLDVSVDNILKAAEKQYGSAYSAELKQNYESAPSASARDSFAQNWSKNYVQSAAPCNYSNQSKWK